MYGFEDSYTALVLVFWVLKPEIGLSQSTIVFDSFNWNTPVTVTVTAADDVDLSSWGTGSWSAWDNAGATVMAYDLKGSTVILQGADLDTVRALAESLLPAEDAVSQDG